MNEQLQQFARETLKNGLAALPEDWQKKFKLMYGRAGGRRSTEDAVAMPIGDIVDAMPAEKLDWEMQQVQRSIGKTLGEKP